MPSHNTQPFFSILVPSYNRPEEIVRNIESILADPFKDIEIIISDDHSPKQAEITRVLAPYLEQENITYYTQPKNLREPNNKNFLISKARGKYNIFLGDDDRFCTKALTTLKNYIEKNPQYDFYGFGYQIVDENNQTIVSHSTRKTLVIGNKTPAAVREVFNADILPLWIFHPATFCCKQGIELKFAYQTDVGMAEDMWFMFDLLSHGHEMLIIPELIFHWRKIQNLATNSQINQSLEHLANYNARKLMYDKLLKNASSTNADLMAYLSSKSYRKRFLYDPLITDKTLNGTAFSELDMCPEYKNELLEYTTHSNSATLKYKNYFKRAFHFIKLVGWISGLKTIFGVLFQRMFYRLKSKFL